MNKLEKLAALLTAFCLLAGCNPQTPAVTTPTPSPTPTPTVAEFALPYDPAGGLHPLTTTSATNLTLMPLLYEGLFAVNAKFEAEPVLCQNVTKSEGGKVWRFLIKSGVTCSNGTAVTAELCKSSILAAKESALYGGRLREIASMEAEGQHLTVTLTVPNANLPLLLDVPVFAAGENGAVAGTGPYVLGENRLTAR
ncbi:MAG: ABC transporter substrate-binding protein, partial [Oscillospiraceae bacterium]